MASMVIAILSDTHMPRGERRLPDACVARVRGADLLLHAGDLVDRGALELLRTLGPPLVAVHGNVDDAAVRDELPAEQLVEAAGARIAMLHDAGPADGRLGRMRRRFPDADVVVFGHSHLPLHERDGGFQLFNPGSPTQRRRAPRHTMGMATVADGAVTLELIDLG
ncbi:MAG: metallophosphoesterase family protein [Solirubrobacterales bacterium]|jgi:putative phosphoesterase|nr:metallophosphoesterase family protein [Solirubrobacterales bacterium]